MGLPQGTSLQCLQREGFPERIVKGREIGLVQHAQSKLSGDFFQPTVKRRRIRGVRPSIGNDSFDVWNMLFEPSPFGKVPPAFRCYYNESV